MPAADRTKSDKLRTQVLALLIVLTVALYAQVVGFEFITIDDPILVSENPFVRPGLTFRGIGVAFGRFYANNWMPLTWLSLMLDATLYDAWAGGYHVTNLIFHAANVVLLFKILLTATDDIRFSAVVAALFAVHPIHAETVAWVIERKGVLSTFFGLLSLLSYLKWAHTRRSLHFFLSLTFFTLSLMAKQMLVTLPFLLIVLDYWPLRRLAAKTLPEKIPFLAISAIFSLIAFLAQSEGLATMALPAESLAFPLRLGNALTAYLAYIFKAVAPYNLGLFYPYAATNLSLIHLAVAIAMLVSLTGLCWSFRAKYPFFLVGWLWFLGTLVPTIGIIHVGAHQMADRYAYFPFIGLYMIVAGFLTSRRLSALVIAVCACLAFFQISHWNNALAITTHSLAVAPESAFTNVALADAYIVAAQAAPAEHYLLRATQVSPNALFAHNHLGEFYSRFKKFTEAKREFQIAILLDESDTLAHKNMGRLHVAQRDLPAAKKEFERALELDPGDQDNFMNLAALFAVTQEFEKSNWYCEQALKINKDHVPARMLLAENFRRLKRWEDAENELRYVLSINPNYPEARKRLDDLVAYRQSVKSRR